MARLSKRVWENNKLTINTKMSVCNACVLSALLYRSETWTTYAHQERRLNNFHLRCLRRILGISWQDRVPNIEVLRQVNTFSMFAILSQRRLRWLGHVHRMEDGRLPKDVLYGELATGARPIGPPKLRFKDVCKVDMKTAKISPRVLGNCCRQPKKLAVYHSQAFRERRRIGNNSGTTKGNA